MANFATPFALNGERRQPTPTEQDQGFACGPASRTLFNEKFHAVEAELGHLMQYAGIAGDPVVHTKVREAIQALIAAATGAGDTSQFVLMTQARARLPIYPEVATTDGKMNVTQPSTGQVRLPAGVTFLHRGIFSVTTAQTDFATDPNKTYHLRWDPTNGFRLLDLANNVYNPTTLADINSTFDSKFDDMLVARVVTNGANVGTITNLANKHRLEQYCETDLIQPSGGFEQNKPPSQLVGGSLSSRTFDVNFARRPAAHLVGFTDVTVQGSATEPGEMNVSAQSLSRYQVRAIYQRTTRPGGALIALNAVA